MSVDSYRKVRKWMFMRVCSRNASLELKVRRFFLHYFLSYAIRYNSYNYRLHVP